MSANSLLVAFALLGCGSSKEMGRDDAGLLPKDGSGDATFGQTDVTGSLYGSPFTLRYAASRRGTASDPRHWLCVADIPVTYAECEQVGSPSRTMFLGPFLYDGSGTPEWSIPQVWLYRVGSDPVSKYAISGTLEVLIDDPDLNRLEITLNVDFGFTPVTSGTVSIGG